MARFMGIDIGSGTSKGVITENGDIKARHILRSGFDYGLAAHNVREELLAKAGLRPEDIDATVTTGYGAANIRFENQHASDIPCCARGIRSIFPEVRTVVDVQGQSSQAIRSNENGLVINFAVSERCATGSGRFIDTIVNVLQVPLEDIGHLSLQTGNATTFTTGCAVFGESEAVSRVAEGFPKEDILAGVHHALAKKLVTLVERVGLEEKCAITGGGGLNIGLVKILEEKLRTELLVPPEPQLVNALGAAILAEESVQDESQALPAEQH